MKSYAIKLVWFTTLYLVMFTVLCRLNINYFVLMCMLVAGQFLVLWMVYKVLTDNYKTERTFKDWYEDRPVKTLEE
jgi:uncharacterized membrane protein YqjE